MRMATSCLGLVWRIIDSFSRESKRLRPCLLRCATDASYLCCMLCACFWHSHKLTGMALPPRILIEYVRVRITWVGQCSSARMLPIENLTSGRRGSGRD